MDNTNDKIFFNFSYFALKLLGKGLYSNPWTAIAELVANGLDAKATCVRNDMLFYGVCTENGTDPISGI